MISDCNNKINSIKFTVYLHDRGNGYVKVAAQDGSLPSHLTRDRAFDNIKDLPKVMTGIKKDIRSYENRIKFICTDCNLGINDTKRIRTKTVYLVPANVDKYDCLFPELITTAHNVLCCPRCGGTNIHKL